MGPVPIRKIMFWTSSEAWKRTFLQSNSMLAQPQPCILIKLKMTFTASGPPQGDGWRTAVPSHYIWDSYDIKTFIFFPLWIHQFHTVLPIKYFHCLKYWIMILPFSLLEGTFPPRWFGAFSSKAPIPSIIHFPIFQLKSWPLTISSCAPIWRKMEAVTFPFGLIPQCVKEAESSSLAYWEESIRLKPNCKGAGEIVEIFGYGFMNRLSLSSIFQYCWRGFRSW